LKNLIIHAICPVNQMHVKYGAVTVNDVLISGNGCEFFHKCDECERCFQSFNATYANRTFSATQPVRLHL
jgi:hypothetical protein